MVYTKSYLPPKPNMEEILRYAGVKECDSGVLELLSSCFEEVQHQLTYKVCYTILPVVKKQNNLDLSFIETDSLDLQRHLAGCNQVVLFAATLGMGFDRLLARYSKVMPSRAFMLQAIGAERIESLCDVFCEELSQEMQQEGYLTSRFSPGYGDLPLRVQRDVFRVLDCPRKIGLTLNESLLMSPSKSVTAFLGISQCKQSTSHDCSLCSRADCEYRRNI